MVNRECWVRIDEAMELIVLRFKGRDHDVLFAVVVFTTVAR